jgi:nucleoid-associated protein YgaU
LQSGAKLYVGLKLRIPFQEGDSVTLAPDLPLVLGEGAMQTVDRELVRNLGEKWISEGKLDTNADEATVLRRFAGEIERWDPVRVVVIKYLVQPGDTWTGIAGRFFGDQMRYPDIMEYNGLAPDAPLPVGETLRIPPRISPPVVGA